MSHQTPSQDWLVQLDELLSTLDAQPNARNEPALMQRVTALDPDLLSFLVERMAEQDSPQAAAFLELLSADPHTPESVRPAARAGRDALVARGIVPAAPGEERFLAGWVQQSRETGEQILLLGWRMPGGGVEALVFLLDWRGDGLKDFYRTRDMTDTEWRQLVEHNATKGAPLAEVTLAEGRALLEAALTEGRRFSRPTPRDYKLESRLIERRILRAIEPLETGTLPDLLHPDLTPEQVVSSYVAALHYRDYTLAVLLLDPAHPLRAGRTVEQAAEALRLQLKHAPRRDPDVTLTHASMPANASAQATGAESVALAAKGTQVAVDRDGRRTRSQTDEIFVLRPAAGGQRISGIVPTASGA